MEYHEIGEQFECDSSKLIVREFNNIRDNRCRGCFLNFMAEKTYVRLFIVADPSSEKTTKMCILS